MFLDSDDIFKKTMLEELYIKIKENNSQIVICNSQNFEIKKYGKKFYKKNYLINDEKLKNKTFSSLEIKKDFFNLFIWWPWDKLFKKKYIENLGIKFQNLKSTEDLFFVASAVIAAKKISYLDEILIYHRVGLPNSVSNSREKSWDNFYYALKQLKKFIKEKGLYKRFKQDFINYIASFSIWQLENMKGKSFCYLYKKLKNEWFNEFGLNKYEKNYFYDLKIYYKIFNILVSDFEIFKILNQINNKDKKINYLKTQKINCFNKFFPLVKFYYNKSIFSNCIKKILNKIFFLNFLIIYYILIIKRYFIFK